jgi:hypothetical protein
MLDLSAVVLCLILGSIHAPAPTPVTATVRAVATRPGAYTADVLIHLDRIGPDGRGETYGDIEVDAPTYRLLTGRKPKVGDVSELRLDPRGK